LGVLFEPLIDICFALYINVIPLLKCTGLCDPYDGGNKFEKLMYLVGFIVRNLSRCSHMNVIYSVHTG